MSKGTQIAVGAITIALLLGWYGLTNLDADATFQYYQTLDEFRASALTSPDQALRVHGYVALESIERHVAARQLRFADQNAPPPGGAPPTPRR